MRVTNSMIAGRVTYNAQNSLTRFLSMQTQMSTGKRINKPSDDPLGITRDLDYRNELANNKQYQGNINQANSWYFKNDEIINSLNEIVSEAKADAVSGADDSFNADGRKAFAAGIRAGIDKILQLGNSQLEGRYTFSGFRTNEAAFQRYANGVTFQGDNGVINYQIDSSAEVGVNMNGADLFLKQILTLGEGFDLDTAINGSTQLSDLHNGDGINQIPGLIQIRDLNLGINATIDLNAETTIDEVITQINNDLAINGINNLTVRIADDNNSLLFEPTQNGLITGTTPLNNINNGAGVDLTSGLINVTDNAGTDINVDLSSAVTVDDVITQFNSQLSSAGIFNVTMSINAAGTGFEINDTNGIPLNLSIKDLENNVNLAEQLGIVGNIGPTLTGSDLAPRVDFAIEELGGTTAEDLGILGEFQGNFIGENLDVQLLTTSNLSDLNNGLGITTGEIVMWQGGTKATLDLDDPS
ncbi:MAG TPA: flagellar hook-associated protein 3, partial [candidate division Zixibacteria bacterium]|nr:flagellar hook-associated protein 3 [candidate division Zixibacteria bacterium]